MKKTIAFFLSLAVALEAGAASELTFDYHADGSCTIVAAACDGDAVVPETVSHEGTTYRVTAIGADAFACRMTSLTLPNSITAIGENAFRRCNYLERVIVESVESWLAIDFANEYSSPLCGFRPLYVGDSELTDLKVPSGISVLKPYSLWNCSSLRSADLGGVAEIGAHAFDGCESLESVTFGDNLRFVGDWAFNICCELKAAKLPDSVESLGEGTFYGCSLLNEVELPSGLKEIPARCFAGCITLETLDFLPPTVESIGDYAFYFCTSLRTARFSESVGSFGEYLFYDCESLESAEIPRSGALLGEFMFANCFELKSVTLPDNISSLPQGLFLECHSLTTVDLPSTITDISDYAFGDCFSLRYIAFPDGLRYIGNRAMYGCRSITRLEFPSNMDRIGTEAFYVCPGLSEIHVHSVAPFAISFFTFDWQADREALVYVPAVSLPLYKDDKFGWANFDNLVGLEAYNPDTQLEIRWGNASMSRAVAFGSEVTLTVGLPDGSLPSKVTFNGEALAVADDGTVTTPPVTGTSQLVIE